MPSGGKDPIRVVCVNGEIGDDCRWQSTVALYPQVSAIIGSVEPEWFDRLCGHLTVGDFRNWLLSDLATPESENPEFDVPRIGTEQVNKLEVLIDELTEVVGPLENFILPGGSPGAAALHVARTVCRRAERRVVSLAREENVGADMVPYLNRLSDALFVMARFENREAGVEEPLWQPGH